MITQNLYEEVLMKPARESADELYIVSGFASAVFATEHLERILELKKRPVIRLIVGMFPQIGNLRYNHPAFQTLSSTDFPGTFECRYNIKPPPVHIKAYAWYKNGLPMRGFIGSANYTRNSFAERLREAVTLCDPVSIRQYFDHLWNEALDCRDSEADRLVEAAQISEQKLPSEQKISPAGTMGGCQGLPSVTLSLLAQDGNIHQVAGLNWGQRNGREPNQAYIPVPESVGRSNFFPPLKQPFTVVTDDDKSLICVSAQPKQRGGTIPHAIHTPLNNSDLGVYFRNRLGVPNGAFVSKENLQDYGRIDVTFCKIDDETYYMDFSCS